jgi:hypothetical protein
MTSPSSSIFETHSSRFAWTRFASSATVQAAYPPSLWLCQAQMWRVFLWLEKMRDYISASGSVGREHLEADNVLGPIYKAFGEKLWPLMEELNLTLAA